LASNHVERLSRREEGLKAKCDLQEGRLSSKSEGRSSATRNQNKSTTSARGQLAGAGNAASKAAELRRLVQKKERLKYAVDRLELQSKQRERQLRKSMAVQ
jgi:DASH complex subunit SPC19